MCYNTSTEPCVVTSQGIDNALGGNTDKSDEILSQEGLAMTPWGNNLKQSDNAW